jgi:hypothetical protein
VRAAALLACTLLAACGPYPRDIGGTLERIEREKQFSVGVMDIPADRRGVVQAYLDRVSQATGARAILRSGPDEALLGRLEAGELDLVIGELHEATPWLDEVAVIAPLSERAERGRVFGLSPIAANGENRWIGLLEREARELAVP